MQKSYTGNYLKIYFWQILSIVLNLLSLFIVIPRISAQPAIYGIYSICISSIIFLSYADLGFMNAGLKFASEHFARKEKKAEIEMVGFVSFILFCFVLLFAAVVTYLAFYPDTLIRNFNNEGERLTAKYLLLILAIFSPNIVLQRALQIFYGVRLEDYVLQKIQVAANILKILSVFFFFTSQRYDITGYFLFCQVVASASFLAGLVIASRKFEIGIGAFLRSIKFSRPIFLSVRSLAFNSLFVTLSWILYYELDPYAIAKLSGAETVAYYAIGFTCLSFFRSIFGTLFNPFTPRFNHFIAMDDTVALKRLYETIMCLLLPVVVFPIVSLVVLGEPFIYAWVGEKFSSSVLVMQLLIMSNILGFITYPCGILLVAQQKVKALYAISTLLPVIFWVTILVLYPYVDFVSFAYAKLLVFLITGISYIWFTLQFLQISLKAFLVKFIQPAILPVLVLIGLLWAVKGFFPIAKSKPYLIAVVVTGGAASAIAGIIYYLTSYNFRTYVNNLVSKFRKTAQ